MNLGDPAWELLDPTPNVHYMFVQFDNIYFWCKLANRVVVRWSKRMYSCAGTCTYEGRGGLCVIALSEPLLKLRPRKDLVETLLHEMIHAFLFVSGQDMDRDGHGPQFQNHMHRINKQAGLNISIYHDFNDEVKLYQTHWWRCNGPCQYRQPYFGIVKRSSNRAPGPNDYWWKDHKRRCSGTFIKIKEPEKKSKKAAKNTKKPNQGDVDRFVTITSDVNKENTVPIINTNLTPKSSVGTKMNGAIDITGTTCKTTIDIWLGKGHITNKKKRISLDTVNDAPPTKITKIDLTNESENVSIDKMTSIINDVYGEKYKLVQNNGKIYPVKDAEIVNCPICNALIKNKDINRHVDECLNKQFIANTDFENDNDVCDVFEPKPSTSRENAKLKNTEELGEIIDLTEESNKQCPCCSQIVKTTMAIHLDECASFMDDNTRVPDKEEKSCKTKEDDELDESQLFNKSGTKYPCPSCLDLIEQDEMSGHLSNCLQPIFFV